MAGSVTSIHLCEISQPIPEIRATNRSRPARARQGNVTLPSESFRGQSQFIEACPRSSRKVCWRAAAFRSPYNCLSLENIKRVFGRIASERSSAKGTDTHKHPNATSPNSQSTHPRHPTDHQLTPYSPPPHYPRHIQDSSPLNVSDHDQSPCESERVSCHGLVLNQTRIFLSRRLTHCPPRA